MKKIFLPAMFALLLITAGCEQPPIERPPEPPPQVKPEVKSDVKTEDKPTNPTDVKIEPEPENNPPQPVEKTEVKSEKVERSMNVKVYYPDDSGLKLVEVEREILVDDTTDKYTAAVETLLLEPEEENLTRIFPKNASIRSVTVEDGLAIVDLDGSILKGFVGGSTGEEFLVGSVVDTLTNFPEITRVKFLVDGADIETLSGHMDLSVPLERMSSLLE